MDAHDLDVLVLLGQDLVLWATGYWRYYGSPSAVVLSSQGATPTMLVMQEEESTARAAVGIPVDGYGARGVGLESNPACALLGALAAQEEVAEAARIGLGGSIAGVTHDRIVLDISGEVVAADAVVAAARRVKDQTEIQRIARAYRICEVAQNAVANAARDGAREIDVYAAGCAAALRAAGAPIEYAADLIGGVKTASICAPMVVADETRLRTGDRVISDILVRHEGYWGDTAGSFVIGTTHADRELATIHSILHETARLLVPGALATDVYQATYEQVHTAFPDGAMLHHVGHGIGVTPFEAPRITPDSDDVLEEGMVVAIEPGIYVAGSFGLRVESLLVVTKNGGRDILSVASADGWEEVRS